MTGQSLSIIALGAHPDDIEISMAGLCLRFARAGHRVSWIIATDGAASRGPSDPTLAAERREEASAAAASCGVELIQLGMSDGKLAWHDGATQMIGALLAERRADLLVTHAPTDYHPDHRALSRMVLDTAPFGTAILLADNMLGVGSGPSILVDISDVFEDKLAALSHHSSQLPEGPAEVLRITNRYRGLQSGSSRFTYAEAYQTVRRLTADPHALLDRVGGYVKLP